MALTMELAGVLRASVSGIVAEKHERRMMPDGFKVAGQNIPQQELFFTKEQIAGID